MCRRNSERAQSRTRNSRPILSACLSIPWPSRLIVVVANPGFPLFLMTPPAFSSWQPLAHFAGFYVSPISLSSEVFARGARMLRTALGPAISGYLDDPGIVEVMLNPDGRLWVDRLSGGLNDTGCRVTPADAERIVRLVAHHVGVEVHANSPRVSAELPESGERFEGLVPPVVAAPCFAIRRPAVAVYTLIDYVEAGIMSDAQAELLRRAVRERKNVLVAGGTSTGKTTLVNAILAEVAKTGDRVVLIEDTRELQCTAPNLVALRTKDGAASLSDLVRASLRLRPDRIPIGEVRGAEALDLLKAWGTGHPGGVGTLHAGSAIGALRRLEQLIQEAVVTVPRALIAETIDLIAVLAGRGSARRLTELAKVEGLSAAGDYVLTPSGEP
jgi:type IV secretion system protein TrbB